MKTWKSIRADALHGFSKCSDGRLYHSILATEAEEAWNRRRRERERKATMRAKRWPVDAGQDADVQGDVRGDVPRDRTRTGGGQDGGRDAGQDADVRSDRTGQDRTGQKEEKKEGSLRSPTARMPRARACKDDPEFATFYSEYPRKDAPDDALKAWRSVVANGSQPAEIISGLRRYQFSRNPQYVKLPGSWLRAGCWKAEADTFDPVLRAAGLAPEDFLNEANRMLLT